MEIFWGWQSLNCERHIMFCVKCGAKVDSTDSFCRKCGAPVKKALAPGSPEPVPAPAAPKSTSETSAAEPVSAPDTASTSTSVKDAASAPTAEPEAKDKDMSAATPAVNPETRNTDATAASTDANAHESGPKNPGSVNNAHHLVVKRRKHGPHVDAMERVSGAPDTHLAGSILVTLFCCQPLGIAAICFAAVASSDINKGNYSNARNHANTANGLMWAAFWSGLVLYIAYAVVTFMDV